MKGLRSMLIGSAMLAAAMQIQAAPLNFSLAEYAINIDGTVSDHPAGGAPAALPGVNLGAFDTATGMGIISIKLSGSGSHHVGLFVDHEIDETANTFFNEYGNTAGNLAAGQSWEIDEPGFRLPNPGDIFANFAASLLDRMNAVPSLAPDDVSMAMAWDFLLNAGETATIDFYLSETAPGGGFYMTQTDPDSQLSVYLTGRLAIQQNNQLPEPTSWALAATALLGLTAARRKPAAPRRR